MSTSPTNKKRLPHEVIPRLAKALEQSGDAHVEFLHARVLVVGPG